MIRVTRSAARLLSIRTRMPFRYGIAELTETPHLFCEIELEVDGERSRGISADSLIPKWFTKDPEQSYEDEITAMLEVIAKAMTHAEQVGDAPDVFTLWRRTYEAQKMWAEQTVHPPLLWNFGMSLVERALIDAFCRVTQTTVRRSRAPELVRDRPRLDPHRTGGNDTRRSLTGGTLSAHVRAPHHWLIRPSG